MRVLLVLLGAAEFPRRLDLSSPTFAKSHAALRDWLIEKAHGPMVEGEDCLDLFDSPRSWPDQEAELADWLADRIATQPPPTDLIVHYVGHGGFRDESRDYYLAIRATRAENAFFSSIMVDSLWRTLRSGARRQRRFLIIDACFAAAAARALMAPLEEAVKVKVRALQDVEGTQALRDVAVLPDRGTAVFCSSSAQDPANMTGTGGVTQFTDGLMRVLRAGSATTKDRLSLAQVHALVKASLSAQYGENAVAPELHAPDQRLGLPQDVPLFPNLAPAELGVSKGRVVQGRAQRFDSGSAWRRQVPLAELAKWKPAENRRDPVDILITQGSNQIPELLPVRYARMSYDPFAFFRGSAAIMAADLASGPSTGLRVQIYGDCHLANFGVYANEGTPFFDINDFDETIPAPFDWEVKRFASSLAIAGRECRFTEEQCQNLVRIGAQNYREEMSRAAQLSPLEIWRARTDINKSLTDSAELRRHLGDRFTNVTEGYANHFGLVEEIDGLWRIRVKPPLVIRQSRHESVAREAFAVYQATFQEHQRALLQQYELRDIAFKVVGIGSVGTFCAIGLFVSDSGAPLLLEIKEAHESVFARYAGASDFNHGERVVIGQRMLQAAAAATDIFLGWTEVNGRCFYVRELRDSRLADIGARFESELPFYAELCGRTLGRAHARAGDATALSAYMGQGTEFEEAIAQFAIAYSDQNERDWRAFRDVMNFEKSIPEKAARAERSGAPDAGSPGWEVFGKGLWTDRTFMGELKPLKRPKKKSRK